MLKKFIIICLVISTFGYGMVWAFDGHWDAQQAQDDVSFGHQAHGDTPAAGDHNDSSCDHCCHASAHLVGIAATGPEVLSAKTGSICSVYTASMISFLDIPASPPPIV